MFSFLEPSQGPGRHYHQHFQIDLSLRGDRIEVGRRVSQLHLTVCLRLSAPEEGSLGIPYRQPGLKSRLQRGPTCCQRAVHLFMKDGKREQALDRGQKRGVFKTKKIPFFSVHPLQFSDLSPPLPLSCKDSNSEIII